MAVDPSVVINIAAEYTGKKAFKQAEGATDKLSKSVKNLAKTFGLTFGTAAVIGYAKASVKAAAADQKAQQQLALALKNVGLERDAASAERFIQRLQSEFGVVDDLLRPAYQKLAVATRDTAETQKLLGIALDISASTGKDLDSVTGALSKAYLGNNTALGKLGVGISKADLKSKSFKDITDDLAVTFKGSAKAASETYAGSIAKLGVAAANVQEIIGTGLIDALKNLGDDTTVADLATNMENLATYTADVIRGFGLMAAALKKIPGLSGLTGASIVQAIPILGSYITLLNQAGAQARRSAEVNAQKNPIQSGSYLSTQKKITALTKEQQKAQAKILADKKSQAILDKANLALAKGNDVFNMDAIQLNAALIGQAEALGKATSSAQILGIANDVQRLKVKQDIAALEDAIASKDDAAIVKATAKLNEDLKILGALQRQDAKLLDINRVLAGMKSTDLINLANLQAALDLLAKFKFPTLTIPGVVIPTPVAPGLPGPGVGGRGGDAGRGSTFGANPLDDFLTILEAETERGGRRGGGIGDTNYVALPPGFNSVDEYLKESRGNRGASDAGTVIVNVNAGAIGDENIIVDAVQNALNEIARRGYTTTYAGAIAV
jgi:hypothetical protein